MVKIAPRALKIGVRSRFYPISTVGFRTFSLKTLARPNAQCTCRRRKKCYTYVQTALEKYSACLGLGYVAFGRVSTKKHFWKNIDSNHKF